MSDLDLIGDRDEVAPVGFVVDNLEKADWALRKIGGAQAEVDKIERYAMALKQRIDERVASILKPHLATIDAMTTFIRPWADVEIAKSNGKKSVKLISGTVGFRQAPASLVVNDEAAAIGWLQGHGKDELVRVKYEVNKTAVKKLIESSGEVPDGCEMKQGEIRFYAEPLVPALESK